MDDERRLACVYVTPELVVHLAVGHNVKIDRNDVPEGAVVKNAAYSERRHAFMVLLKHESFHPVPLGEEVPHLQGPIYTRIEETDDGK